ncbi:MAG: DMT family transporter [Acidobacteriota bacterium]
MSDTSVRPSRSAMASLGVAVVAVSWAAILIRLADAPTLVIAFWRLALATGLLAPVAALHARRAGRTSPPGPTARDRRGMPWLVPVAGALLAGHFVLWIASLFLTSVANSVMLVTTQPIFAALLARPLLGEPAPVRTWAAIALSLAGALCITARDLTVSRAAMVGDLLAILAAAAAATYLVLGRRARDTGPLTVYLTRVNGVATGLLLLCCLLFDAPLRGYAPATWAAFAALAVGPHLAGHGLLNFAVRRLPAPAVNLALLGEPILSTIYAALLFHEIPTGWFYVGGALVLTGVGVEFVPRGGRRR